MTKINNSSKIKIEIFFIHTNTKGDGSMIGVYAIRNTKNNKMYIGESLNILLRWKFHKEALNNGTHHSYKLQADWDKYGAESFKFQIVEKFTFPYDITLDRRRLEICLLCREYYHIKKNHSVSQGYNIEGTLKEIYHNNSKNKELAEYLGDDIQELIKDNKHLFTDEYNLDTIIKFASTDINPDDIIEIKEPKSNIYKAQIELDLLPISRINKFVKTKLGFAFTRCQLAELLIEYNYIEELSEKKYKITQQGIDSGFLIQRSKIFLTPNGQKFIIDYLSSARQK